MEEKKRVLIEKMLVSDIKESELPKFFYNYMAGMIVEEPPSNGKELQELIGDFIQNGNKKTKEESMKICDEISNKLISDNLIHLENKLTMTAEKLDAPVTLNNFNLLGENDINSGYVDAFLGIEKINFGEDSFRNESKMMQKKREKEEKKQKEAFDKHIIELDRNRQRLPPTVVNHSKETSKIKDFKVENIVLVVGGRTLLDDARLFLPYGRKYGLIGRNGIGKTSLLSVKFKIFKFNFE